MVGFVLLSCHGVDAAQPTERKHLPKSEPNGQLMNMFPLAATALPSELSKDTRPGAKGPTAPIAAVLVLFDDSGPYAWLGELQAIVAANLVGHFGAWDAKPVSKYLAGDVANHTATVYIGSTYDQSLPAAFLDEVLTGTKPVLWIYNNIWQLANRSTNFAAAYGFMPWAYDTTAVAEVVYKGVTLTRSTLNAGGIMDYSQIDATRAVVLAQAVRPDGSQFPWAIRAKNLTYVGESPFAYINETDRFLAFCDLLFDVLAPSTAERHRALVRIEDVSANSDPEQLRAIADYLASERVPFSVATIPLFTDPRGYYTNGVPVTIRMKDAPDFVSALKYMMSRGGTLIQHGYTHQYSNIDNPYSGVSGDDFEFFLAHIDEFANVIYDGPVPEDSAAWAQGRLRAGLDQFKSVKLPGPTIFEYPHYAGSPIASREIAKLFRVAYHRGLYFGGALTGLPDDVSHHIGSFFPYVVEDIYGLKILPENMGNYRAVNNVPTRSVEDLLNVSAKAWVVRDGFASFFFHPYYPLSVLQDIVKGVKAQGYTFVTPTSL